VKLLPVRRLTVEQPIGLRCCRVCGLEQERKKGRQRAVWASDDAVASSRAASGWRRRAARAWILHRSVVRWYSVGGMGEVAMDVFFDCMSMYGIGVSTFHGLSGRADSKVIATWRCCIARADGAL
jgi:hypothetical protein